MLVTLPVFQPETLSVVKPVHFRNMSSIKMTLPVFQPERSSESKLGL